MNVRSAEISEIDHIAQLWHDAWHETHKPIMPAALAEFRTLSNFRDRVEHYLDITRVAGPAGAALGFSIVKGDELYQLYLAPEGRGTGIGPALLEDAERQISDAGHTTAWLACAIGNERAAKFYEKFGWQNVRTEQIEVETAVEPFKVEIWRFEKDLTS